MSLVKEKNVQLLQVGGVAKEHAPPARVHTDERALNAVLGLDQEERGAPRPNLVVQHLARGDEQQRGTEREEGEQVVEHGDLFHRCCGSVGLRRTGRKRAQDASLGKQLQS